MTEVTQFSNKFSSVEDWLKVHPEDTPYRRRILRMRRLYPEASLSQLRGHPTKVEVPLYWSKIRQVTPSVPAQFMQIVERYAEVARCFELDEKGRRMIWKRPMNEPQ